MLKSLFVILACVVIGVSGQLMLKTGMNKIGRIDSAALASPLSTLSKMFLNPTIIVALSLYIIGMILWLVVLSRENLSFAYPLLGSTYLVVVLFSKIFFQEQVSLTRWIGAAVISLGVILVTRS